jgi:hypothetical protein
MMRRTPGAAFGLAGGDGADAGVVVRAAQAFQVQQAVEAVVVEIWRAAGDVAEDVLAQRRLADLVEIVVALVGEQVLAEFHHDADLEVPCRPAPRAAASRMASMIGS